MQKPTLKTQPSTLKDETVITLRSGSSISLICTGNVTPNLPFKYQWFKSGLFLPKQEKNILWLENITLSDAGEYNCATTSEKKKVLSNVLLLDVISECFLSS